MNALSLPVRASSLDSYNDCRRSGAANIHYRAIREGGHELGTRRPGGAEAVGTGLHAVMHEVLRHRQMFGQCTREDVTAAIENAKIALKEELKNGFLADKTTPREEVALMQVEALAEKFLPFAQQINPRLVEIKHEYLVSPLGSQAIPVLLSGTIDYLDIFGEIGDWKTGKNFPAAHAQMGAYLILLQYLGYDVNNLRIIWGSRVGYTVLHKIEVRAIRFDPEECINAAWATIKQIQIDYENWLQSGGDPWAFGTNNKSQTCTPNYCIAYGTSWCKVGRPVLKGDE